jgi:hypothetical protein
MNRSGARSRLSADLVRAACVLHRKPTTSPAYWQGWGRLRSKLGGQFHAVFAAVAQVNRQRDSLELPRQFGETFPDAMTHVVRNGHYGTPDRFVLYQDSKIRKSVEAKGRSLDFPELA